MSVTFSFEYPASTPDDLEVSLSNMNARSILNALGVESDELMGSFDARDLKGRALLVSTGIGLTPRPTVSDGNVTTLGQSPDYFARIGGWLFELAEAAEQLNVRITYA